MPSYIFDLKLIGFYLIVLIIMKVALRIWVALLRISNQAKTTRHNNNIFNKFSQHLPALLWEAIAYAIIKVL